MPKLTSDNNDLAWETCESLKGCKLVRDNMDRYINPKYLREATDPDEIETLLRKKLIEEMRELVASDFNDPSEWADVFLVLDTLLKHKKIDRASMSAEATAKDSRRGKFNRFLVWSYKDDPEFDGEKFSHLD